MSHHTGIRSLWVAEYIPVTLSRPWSFRPAESPRGTTNQTKNPPPADGLRNFYTSRFFEVAVSAGRAARADLTASLILLPLLCVKLKEA